MALKLVPFTHDVMAEIETWYPSEFIPTPPHAVVCADEVNVLGAIGYHLADGDMLVVATVYLSPAHPDKQRLVNYMGAGIKHLATMTGRFPVTLKGPFIAKKSPLPSTEVEGSQRRATKPVEDNVTVTSGDVKDELEGW